MVLETSTSSQEHSLATAELFLVCGLGAMGQHCIALLKGFGVQIAAIDQVKPSYWEIPNLRNDISTLVIGDCRQNSVLEAAQVKQCRAVLLVTSDEHVNAETALAVRSLNPKARLVLRSAQSNLNQLLSQYLGDFVALEPTQLSAGAFALAALGTETLGFFQLDSKWLRVVKRPVRSRDRPVMLHEMQTSSSRLLTRQTANPQQSSRSFYEWDPEQRVEPGDVLICIETADKFLLTQSHTLKKRRGWQNFKQRLNPKNVWRTLSQSWQAAAQAPTRRVALVCGVIVLGLLLVGTVLFSVAYPGATPASAFYATMILLLGGYADLFGEVEASNVTAIPGWLRLFSLSLTLTGTALVGVLYALVTGALLSSKFQLTPRRPPVPTQDHIILIGLRRVGQRVAQLLLDFKQVLVGVPLSGELDQNILPQMSVVNNSNSNVEEGLAKANLATAKSVIIETEDEMRNLEIGLMVNAANPNCQVVIQTYGQRLSDNLAQLLPRVTVICAYAVAAEAFAGAAFGENIISLFRLNDQTILVTEYAIETGDTLDGLLLAEVAYGYDVVPILYQKQGKAAKLLPTDDLRLSLGDRLVVLASIDGLRRIERGELNSRERCWQVQVETVLTPQAVFEGGNMLSLVSGCDLKTARHLMNELPAMLPTLLYKHQAKRLIRKLRRVGVRASLHCNSTILGTQPCAK